jgi:hypothetical protein
VRKLPLPHEEDDGQVMILVATHGRVAVAGFVCGGGVFTQRRDRKCNDAAFRTLRRSIGAYRICLRRRRSTRPRPMIINT